MTGRYLPHLPFERFPQEGGTGFFSLARYTAGPEGSPRGVGVLGIIDADGDNVAAVVTPQSLETLIDKLIELRNTLRQQAAAANN